MPDWPTPDMVPGDGPSFYETTDPWGDGMGGYTIYDGSGDGPSFYETGPYTAPSTYDGSSDGPSFYEAGPYTGADDTFTGAEMTYYEWDHDWE